MSPTNPTSPLTSPHNEKRKVSNIMRAARCGNSRGFVRTSSFTPRRSYSAANSRREASQMRPHAFKDSSSPDCSFVTASRDRVLKPSSSSNRCFAALHGRRRSRIWFVRRSN